MALKVLIVGSGITGAIISTYLRKKCNGICKVVVWDKARGAGGRMSTSRSPTMDSCIADLGAQYITTMPQNIEANKDVYATCFAKGLLQPLETQIEGMHDYPKDTVHFVTPKGINSLVKEFLMADELHFNRHITSVMQKDDKLCVQTKGGHKDSFDIIVLTMPIPQILQLSESIGPNVSSDKKKRDALSAVKYSSRYAVGFFYDDCIDFDVPWSAKYISDDDVLRYVAIDNKKRNQCASPSAVVFHTTVKYGEKNVDRSIADVQVEIVKYIETVFPSWPKPISVKCQKWRFSQATSVYEESLGCVTFIQEPLLIAGGDGFAKSTFDGCIFSAKAVASAIEIHIREKGSTIPE